ncbi:MAG: TonB-dependent receptor [Candidatus Cloacimonetes bacterium]|nr:TonB-dependent receptor [Candidatus Cloacimonadota bacterium]
MKKLVTTFILVSILFVSIPAFAQATGKIAGRITDSKGNQLNGVAVFLEGTDIGSYTKEDGTYIISNVNAGTYTIHMNLMGYKSRSRQITVAANLTQTVNLSLTQMAVEIEGFKITATRAVERETPIAFTNVTSSDIQDKYTTEDLPQLINNVPGLFASSGGLGEGDIYMRGFDPDKVQIMINGIPVNDPESQQVYWSNWTGLSSNVQSVQVQRGVGSSLYGSGAFGGSVNIETLSQSLGKSSHFTLRTSVGMFTTDGADGGDNDGKVADGKGEYEDYSPMNYNLLVKYRSGRLFDGKFNYNLMFERKGGDSYQNGTTYDGYSFGVEAQSFSRAHTLNYSFIGAPQKHNQARATTDMELIKTLGREYNRNNNDEQENYYFKPQFSIRDEWQITEKQLLMTNVFFTMGTGGGKYLRNDEFDVETGEILYKELSDGTDWKYFGRHARYVYEKTGVVLSGYIYQDTTYTLGAESGFVSKGRNVPNSDYNHSWHNDSQNEHKQFGFNTYYKHNLNEMITLIFGGELRHWIADHFAETKDFRYNGGIYADAERRYDYTTTVTNYSGFLRTQLKPFTGLNFMFDVQYASYTSTVEENEIQIFDFGTGQFLNEYYYATKANFEDDDYTKTFNFTSPKFGVNYNINDYFNVLSNYSIAYKEPRVTDWYSRSGGPDVNQTADDGTINELNPEKTSTIEFGGGYTGLIFDASVNYYITDYEDRVESIYLESGESYTINAGNAKHKGIEFSGNMNINNLDAMISATYAKNRWEKMNLDKIFGVDAEEIEGKVVPFSPEKMVNGELGYTFNSMPLDGKLRIGLGFNWWDEYYGTYRNDYYTEYEYEDPDQPWLGVLPVESSLTESKLPYFFAVNSNIKYSFKIGTKDANIRLDIKNLNNRKDNYSRASYGADYGRNDILNGVDYMTVTPAPLMNVFLTAEVNF